MLFIILISCQNIICILKHLKVNMITIVGYPLEGEAPIYFEGSLITAI